LYSQYCATASSLSLASPARPTRPTGRHGANRHMISQFACGGRSCVALQPQVQNAPGQQPWTAVQNEWIRYRSDLTRSVGNQRLTQLIYAYAGRPEWIANPGFFCSAPLPPNA
jgi:hypothetical protein